MSEIGAPNGASPAEGTNESPTADPGEATATAAGATTVPDSGEQAVPDDAALGASESATAGTSESSAQGSAVSMDQSASESSALGASESSALGAATVGEPAPEPADSSALPGHPRIRRNELTRELAAIQKELVDADARIARTQETARRSTLQRVGLRHAPGLDGIRGLAVLAVIIYHLDKNWLPGGFLGVDVFFVLSGFLITSLLVREHRVTRTIDLREFWRRRVRRIFPAAILVLVVGTAAAGWVGGDAAVKLPQQFFGTLFFVNNWVQIADSQSYFATSGVQIFAHYWSLAVEEQFYVIWPLLFCLLALVRKRRVAVIATVVLAVASALGMALLYDPAADPTRVYYGTDTHAFGLLIGALTAFALCSPSHSAQADSWPRRLAHWGWWVPGIAALVGVLALIATLGDTSPVAYRGGILLSSVLTALVVAAVVCEVTPLNALFSLKPLRWLGQRSFSLYLWHWPVIGLLRGADMPVWLFVLLALTITLALSMLSYEYVENPFRRGGYRATWRMWFAPVWTIVRQAPALVRGVLATVLVATVVVVGMVHGLVTSPSQTALERELSEAAARQEEARRNAEQARLRELASRTLPEGSEITAIGDSVLLASQIPLEEEWPGIYVDGAVSRAWEALPRLITEYDQAGVLDQFVILSFGTNGNAEGSEIELDDVVKQLGDDRVIIMVSPYGDRAWMPQARDEINAAARDHENVYVANWCQAAADDPANRLRDDLIHPTPPGALAYIQAIKDALNQWHTGEKVIPQECA